jgi:GTP cyclohydrolase II
VYIADHIAATLNLGFRLDIADTAIDPAVLEDLGVTEAQVNEIIRELPAKIEEAESLLS